jgi:hypothetical protein
MKHLPSATPAQDLLGKRIAKLLDDNTDLSYEVTERLRAARTRALSLRRIAQPQLQTVQEIQTQNGFALLKFPSQIQWFFQTFGSLIPLLGLVAGLVLINEFHNDQSALELAEIDSALLTDDLPPNAYTDPSFLDYLKYQVNSQQN